VSRLVLSCALILAPVTPTPVAAFPGAPPPPSGAGAPTDPHTVGAPQLEVAAVQIQPLEPPALPVVDPAPLPPEPVGEELMFAWLRILTGDDAPWRCIAWAESRDRQYAVGAAGELGWLQIHPFWWRTGFARLGRADIAALDPYSAEAQAAGAAAIWFDAGRSWRPWTTAKGCGLQ
jgi:hypothetical protein